MSYRLGRIYLDWFKLSFEEGFLEENVMAQRGFLEKVLQEMSEKVQHVEDVVIYRSEIRGKIEFNQSRTPGDDLI